MTFGVGHTTAKIFTQTASEVKIGGRKRVIAKVEKRIFVERITAFEKIGLAQLFALRSSVLIKNGDGTGPIYRGFFQRKWITRWTCGVAIGGGRRTARWKKYFLNGNRNSNGNPHENQKQEKNTAILLPSSCWTVHVGGRIFVARLLFFIFVCFLWFALRMLSTLMAPFVVIDWSRLTAVGMAGRGCSLRRTNA